MPCKMVRGAVPKRLSGELGIDQGALISHWAERQRLAATVRGRAKPSDQARMPPVLICLDWKTLTERFRKRLSRVGVSLEF